MDTPDGGTINRPLKKIFPAWKCINSPVHMEGEVAPGGGAGAWGAEGEQNYFIGRKMPFP